MGAAVLAAILILIIGLIGYELVPYFKKQHTYSPKFLVITVLILLLLLVIASVWKGYYTL